MSAWQKPLKVGKTDRYSVDLTNWLDGQAVASVTFTSAGGVTVGATSIDGNVVSALLTGAVEGVDSVDVAYSTTTRSDCEMISLRVIADC